MNLLYRLVRGYGWRKGVKYWWRWINRPVASIIVQGMRVRSLTVATGETPVEVRDNKIDAGDWSLPDVNITVKHNAPYGITVSAP